MVRDFTRTLENYFATPRTPEEFREFLDSENPNSSGDRMHKHDTKAVIAYDYLAGKDGKYMDVLFSFHPDILQTILQGDYALHDWIRDGRSEYFTSLLRHYSMDELRDIINRNIRNIISSKNEEIFTLLVEKEYLNEENRDAILGFAIEADNIPVMDYLLYSEEKVQPAHFIAAVAEGNVATIQRMIMFGGNINLADSKGVAPLTVALRMGKVAIIKLLLDYGANVNIVSWSNGESPLMVSIMRRDLHSLVKDFILAGADVNHRTWSGQTPLSVAVNYKDITDLLLSSGATDYGEKRKEEEDTYVGMLSL